jgi:methionine-rich copper-binding protein CopC
VTSPTSTRRTASARTAASRAPTWLAVLLVTATVALIGGVAPANAHNVLVRTDPVDGSTVASLPDVIVLTFNEPGDADGTVIAVTGPAGNVASGVPTLVDSEVRQAVGPGSPAGRYTVNWRVVSSDGHPIDGSFAFTASTGTSGTATPRPSDAPTIPAAAAGAGATGWAIAAAVAIFALGIGAILLYRRRPDPSGAARDDDD